MGCRAANFDLVLYYLQYMRLEGKERHNKNHGIWQQELVVMSSIVLLILKGYVAKTSLQVARSLQNLSRHRRKTDVHAWGVRRIAFGRYICRWLTVSRKYTPDRDAVLIVPPDLDQEVVPTLEQFLATDGDDLSDIPDHFDDD